MASYTEAQNTKSAGYTCNFVEQPPKLFICEVCKLVLRDPRITQCCRKYACRPCLEKEAENGAPCPVLTCQNQCMTKFFPDRDLHHDILRSRVYCNSRASGCEWAGPLENLDKHLLECVYLEEECQNSCGMKVQRHVIKEHNAVCERFPIKCQQCGDLYERREQSSHLNKCSLTKVKCPFNLVGCTAEILNKDLQQHIEESLSEHYDLVAKQSDDVQAEIGEIKVLAQSKENMKHLIAQSMEVAGINDDLVAAEKEMVELQRTLEEAQLELKELEQRCNLASAELQQQISRSEASICAVREECDQLVFTSKVRCYGPALPCIHPADIVSCPLDCCPVAMEEYVPRVSFMIPRFQEERKNDTCLCLPPFYSHREGYRMCLFVYCNGFLGVKGEYVSIYVRVFSGKYDTKLYWPLHCKVEIEIPSIRKPTASVRNTIEVKPQCPIPGETFNSHTQGSCPRALSQREGIGYEPLSGYLRDGCLTIAVVRVTFQS